MKRPHDIKGLFNVYYNSSFVCQTMAVSVKQAINNARHNLMGETTSQYVDPAAWSATEATEISEGGFTTC